MPNTVINGVNNNSALLINNPNPLPDGTVSNANVVTLAAAGTTQLDATPLTGHINMISNNTAANGAILPVGSNGQVIKVFPKLVTNAPKIYPPVGGTLNFGSLNASVAATAQKTAEYTCIDTSGLNWIINQSA